MSIRSEISFRLLSDTKKNKVSQNFSAESWSTNRTIQKCNRIQPVSTNKCALNLSIHACL